MSKNNLLTLVVLASIAALFILAQIWISAESQRRIDDVIARISVLQSTQIDDERLRQELINLSVENTQKTLSFQNIITSLGASIGILVTFSGAMLGILQYMNMRRKDQLDRAVNQLSRLWVDLSSENPGTCASAIAGLQQFFSRDKREFHEQVVSALALAGRMENNHVLVQRTLTPIIEKAMREMPAATRKVSWQGLTLYRPNFSELNLNGIDLRDCRLIEADFSGAQLREARFDAATLIAGKFDGVDFTDANLEFADFASASLKGANFTGANLYNIKLLDSDWDKAVLKQAKLSRHATDWRLAKNWRSAEFDSSVKNAMLQKYGKGGQGPRILVLLWEYYPVVAGGGWTAAYHLFQNLLHKGANFTVFVPWPKFWIDRTMFGNDIEVIAVGLDDLLDVYSAYNTASAYTGAFGFRGQYDVYNSSPFGFRGQYDEYNRRPFGFSSQYNEYSSQGVSPLRRSSAYSSAYSTPLEQSQDFAQRVYQTVEEQQIEFDVIYAHDWITFSAAELLQRNYQKPWIAHIHSLEADRQRYPSFTLEAIERRACELADRIIVPSHVTQARIKEQYQTEDKIQVMPNCLSANSAPIAPIGNFYQSKVVFLGRLSWQKGPDLFQNIAREILKRFAKVEFLMVGSGDMETSLNNSISIRETRPPFTVSPLKERRKPQSIAFEAIKPIEFDEATGTAKLDKEELRKNPVSSTVFGGLFQPARTTQANPKEHAEKSSAFARLEDFILKHGFTVYQNDLEPEKYTHRIVVNNVRRNEHRDYLVKATGLKPMETRQSKYVPIQEARDWLQRFSVFNGASVVIVPSRYEPFGLVILEAMQAGVPVVFAETAGAAEVLQSGIRIDPQNAVDAAEKVVNLLTDQDEWRRVVEVQRTEIESYPSRNYEDILVQTVDEVVKRKIQ